MNNHAQIGKVDVNFASEPLLIRVDAIAKAYHSRNKWADRDDLIQVARITAISAVRLWDPFRGTPVAVYVGSAVRRALWGHILQQRTVTHNPSREPAPRDTDISLHEPTSSNRAPLREAIASALAGNDLATRALLGGELPREIAERTGFPIAAIYSAISRGRAAIRESAVCARAWSESLGMECSPIVWHDCDRLFQAACRHKIHRAAFSPKLLKSLIEMRLGTLPEGYKFPRGFTARMKKAHAAWYVRYRAALAGSVELPGIGQRLRARKASTEAKYAELLKELCLALQACQGPHCKERMWTTKQLAGILRESALSLGLPRLKIQTGRINAGGPGKAYKDRWSTTAVTIHVYPNDQVELLIGRGDYGVLTSWRHVYTHLATLRMS